MGIELARAYVRVGVDSAEVERGFSDIIHQMDGIASTATVMGGIVAGAFGMATRSAIMAAGKFEQTMIAFETMMGSASKASTLLADLTEFAALTPFEMPEIEQVARGLVMFGEDSKSLMETLTMLGNAASGTSSNFGMLGLIFNQIRGVGRLLTQDFRQLSTRGVISLRDIAKYYKVTDAAAQEMISRGKVSFEDFRKIMLGLTSESGRFANMMEKQSKSMLGLLSTFSDAWRITLRQIGEEIVPVAKWFVDLGNSVLGAFGNMDKGSKMLIAGTIAVSTVMASTATTVSGLVFAISKGYGALTGLSASLKAAAAANLVYDASNLGVFSSTVKMTAANKAATAGLYALAAAKYAAAAAGIGLAVAVAGLVSYKLGQWLWETSEAGKNAKRVMDDLKESVEGIPEIDFSKKIKGIREQDRAKYLQDHIAQIEGQIAATERHIAAMQKENGFWHDNTEVIGQNNLIVEKLKSNLESAQEQLIALNTNPEDLKEQLGEAQRKAWKLTNEIAGLSTKLGDAENAYAKASRQAEAGGIVVFEVTEKEIEQLKEKIAQLEKEKQAQQGLIDTIKKRQEEVEVDDKATEKIKETIEALQIEADTYSMTAAEAAYHKDILNKVEPAIAAEHAAAIERAEERKRIEEEANKRLQEREFLLDRVGRMKDPFTDPFKSKIEGTKEPKDDTWFQDLMQKMEWAADIGITPLQEFQDQVKKLDDLMATGLYGQEWYAEKMKDLGKTLTDSVLTPEEKLIESTKLWDEALKKKAITQDQYNRLLEKGKKELEGTKKSVEDLFGTSSGFVEFGRKIQDAISGSSKKAKIGENPLAIGAPAGIGVGAGKGVGEVAGRGAGGAAGGEIVLPSTRVSRISSLDAAAAFHSLTPADLGTIPGLSGGTADFDNAFKPVVKALQDGNKKIDEVVKAIKNQPKGGLL